KRPCTAVDQRSNTRINWPERRNGAATASTYMLEPRPRLRDRWRRYRVVPPRPSVTGAKIVLLGPLAVLVELLFTP
ncbi:MAG TPA: hypothetical protein VN325_13185, partial [Steroidobacteraceae bacterium]|nr:hypothetical protein [Steroidobacteraceae bacterium]